VTTNAKRIKELLEECASLIPLSEAPSPEAKARIREIEEELQSLGAMIELDLDSLG
jgi:hypothetical protein